MNPSLLSALGFGSYTFFLAAPIVINYDTAVVVSSIDINYNEYEYMLGVNITRLINPYTNLSYAMNDLFNARTYTRNGDGIDIAINTSNDEVYYLLTSNIITMTSADNTIAAPGTSYSLLPSRPESVGKRLLEIIATKIFGNPYASIAFSNTIEYLGDREIKTITMDNTQITEIYEYEYSIPAQAITNGLYNSISSNGMNFFKQYVSSGKISIDTRCKIERNDTSLVTLFNMQKTEVDLPIFFTGSMTDSVGDNLPESFWSLYDQPSVGGNTITSDGQYNIPIILRLHD
jgi:hypothetical protein